MFCRVVCLLISAAASLAEDVLESFAVGQATFLRFEHVPQEVLIVPSRCASKNFQSLKASAELGWCFEEAHPVRVARPHRVDKDYPAHYVECHSVQEGVVPHFEIVVM